MNKACHSSFFVSQRQLTSALMKWDECITQLKTCAAKVAAKAADSQFPYLLFLGSGRSLQARGILSDLVAVSDAVIRDCLCHVQAIEKCLASTRANQVGWWLSECFSTACAAGTAW